MDAVAALRSKVRRKRGGPGMTQGQVAKVTGLSQSQVSLILAGELAPSLGRVPALNALLGTSFDDWARVADTVTQKRAKRRGKRAA